MTTFNAEVNNKKPYSPKIANRTFNLPNQGGRNHTRSDIHNNSNKNKTFNAMNNTINVPNRTFIAVNPDHTFDNKKSFNANIPRTTTFNAENQTFNVKNSLNQTFNAENQVHGPDAFNNELTAEDRILINKIELICMDIRSFIISIYKFFCNNRSCNWEMIYKLIGEIDLTTQSMINEIFMQQMRIEDEREASQYSSYESDSNLVPSTFDDQSSSYQDNSQSILNDIQRRMDYLNVKERSSQDLLQGLSNIEKAGTNLRKYKNFSKNLNLESEQ